MQCRGVEGKYQAAGVIRLVVVGLIAAETDANNLAFEGLTETPMN